MSSSGLTRGSRPLTARAPEAPASAVARNRAPPGGRQIPLAQLGLAELPPRTNRPRSPVESCARLRLGPLPLPGRGRPAALGLRRVADEEDERRAARGQRACESDAAGPSPERQH